MATAADPGFMMSSVRFFQDGGPWMWPILVVFLLGIALVVERFVYLQMVTGKNSRVWGEIYPLLAKGQFKQVMEIAKGNDTFISGIVGAGLTRATITRRHEDIGLAMEESLMEVMPRLEQRTPYIATLANIATLLGLLGTIMGLIDAFTAIASADPAQKAAILSSSISVAMNTTAFGLIAAIPLMLAFTYLQSKTAKVVESMEMASVKLLNIYRQLAAASEKNQGD